MPADLGQQEAPDAPAPLPDPHKHHLVRALQREVIPRLASAHRQAEPTAAAYAAPTSHEVGVFTARLIDGHEPGVVGMVERLRRRGASAETIYLDLLAPAARKLGELWSDDQCDFATVTVGVARLQRLMRELSPSFCAALPAEAPPRTILLAQAPGEQHGLGMAMVAEFFRRDGWLVEWGAGPQAPEPASRAQAEWFDVVGLSLGTEALLPWLRDQIGAIRLASRNAGVVVLVGGPLFALHPNWVEHVGADACAQDARDAPALAAQWVEKQAVAGHNGRV